MVKVFVDDLRPCPEGWTLARTNTEAISLLATGYVDEISLDFDIRQCSFQKHWTRETFEPVYQYILLMSNKPEIRIHTGNTTEGQRWAKIFGIPWIGVYDPVNYL